METAFTAGHAESSRIRVLYIDGMVRSGSTILGRILADTTDAVHVGEIQDIWQLIENDHLCECRRPICECPFWSEVFEKAFGGFDGVDIGKLAKTNARLHRLRYLLKHAAILNIPGVDQAYATYFDALERLYRAIAEVSGASVIVDSSKSPAYGFTMSRIRSLDVRWIHLVRDSRAVAHSFQRLKLRPRSNGGSSPVQRMGSLRAAIHWQVRNLLLDRLLSKQTTLFLRYEDFVSNADEVVSEISAFAGIVGDRSTSHQGPFTLKPAHVAGGNVNKYEREIVLRIDDEWQSAMPAQKMLLVTAVTMPLLMRYGYNVVPSSPKRRPGSAAAVSVANASLASKTID